MHLKDLGWNDYFQAVLHDYKDSDLTIARVSLQQKQFYKVMTPERDYDAVIAGKLRHEAASTSDFPVVGDWVLVEFPEQDDKAIIKHVLPRKTKISRDTGSRKSLKKITDEQVVVANVDLIFLVSALDADLNLRRLERYLALIWDSGASPVLVLNKADACENAEEIVQDVQEVAMGVPVHVVSAVRAQGIDELKQYLQPGITVALLGSSGVGKSTIINKLLGEEKFKIAEIGEYKDKGRHTTTHREMVMLPDGGILIDNPGMRAVQVWEGDEGISKSFEDIETYAQNCRFNDCRHVNEPECAVIEAVEQGEIPQDRYESYLKLLKEQEYRSRKENWATRQNSKRRWKSISKSIRRYKDKDFE